MSHKKYSYLDRYSFLFLLISLTTLILNYSILSLPAFWDEFYSLGINEYNYSDFLPWNKFEKAKEFRGHPPLHSFTLKALFDVFDSMIPLRLYSFLIFVCAMLSTYFLLIKRVSKLKALLLITSCFTVPLYLTMSFSILADLLMLSYWLISIYCLTENKKKLYFLLILMMALTRENCLAYFVGSLVFIYSSSLKDKRYFYLTTLLGIFAFISFVVLNIFKYGNPFNHTFYTNENYSVVDWNLITNFFEQFMAKLETFKRLLYNVFTPLVSILLVFVAVIGFRNKSRDNFIISTFVISLLHFTFFFLYSEQMERNYTPIFFFLILFVVNVKYSSVFYLILLSSNLLSFYYNDHVDPNHLSFNSFAKTRDYQSFVIEVESNLKEERIISCFPLARTFITKFNYTKENLNFDYYNEKNHYGDAVIIIPKMGSYKCDLLNSYIRNNSTQYCRVERNVGTESFSIYFLDTKDCSKKWESKSEDRKLKVSQKDNWFNYFQYLIRSTI